MSRNELTRRKLLAVASTGIAATRVARPAASSDKPAILGGQPVRAAPFPSWPVIDGNEERAWMEVLHGGKWNRLDGDHARRFEETWASTLGAKHCLATANGTSALFASLNALGIGPGDEVIVPPYTFVATVNVVLLQHALPVFVDTDPETFQIDARKIEAAITDRTRCILPVHLGGSPADLDAILEIGRKHHLPVLEDACQAHLAEWRGRKVSTLGALGCFSFQASKNLNSGEGGAILTNDTDLYNACQSFHNNGRGNTGSGFGYVRNGANLRMTEFQAALLLEQFKRVDQQSRTREQNAAYLTKQLAEIPGIAPARMYSGATRNAYHLYMFRYDKTRFANLPRSRFLAALNAEGIPASSGYTPLNQEPFLKHTFDSRAYRAVYPAKQLAEWVERNHCPANDRLCEEAVWFTQTMLLGPRDDMDAIAAAVRKVQGHAPNLLERT
ncbi:MAG: DegT/DnrJ/EryC1/StrS family aminotransferase [Acidobacteriia bacterium]|nr:DegT/DnrJ/EryC1/StrS family aminotransferase [Terriglobia bacterium]